MSDTAIEALRYSEFPNSSDCISRQAAIDVLTESLNKIPMINNTTNEMIRRDERITCIHEIIRLPSAEPKTGKWIIQDNPKTGWYKVECSECDEDVTSNIPMIGFFPHCKPLWDFCPHCGADMRGEEE